MSAYRAIAKLKRNDVQAFNLLDVHLRCTIAPTFEVLHAATDLDDPEKVLLKGLNAFHTYRGEATATVDLDRFLPGLRIRNEHPAKWGYDEIFAKQKRVIPVLGMHAEPESHKVILDAARKHGLGLCLRVDGDDILANPARLVRALPSLVERSGLPLSKIDVLFDFGKLGRFPRDNIVLATVGSVGLMDGYGLKFRSITVAGSSVVDFVNDAASEEHTTGIVKRQELEIWTRVSRMLGWHRGIQLADYGIVHPMHRDNIRNKNANGKLRYTVGSGTHYFRGCSKQNESLVAQYPTLVRRLVASDVFRGARFSAADKFFAHVAASEKNTGDTGRWVQLDMNHHLSYLGRQVQSTLGLPDKTRSSQDAVDEYLETY